ncbi:hypothetical protein St703_22850 [Sporolactobacillus terrae]|uniref:Uncharacterized protein n=1 Tax=Sporolactobacillus terrae TaxID=269673 RepID=A0A5K7X4G2_9BACL|nr:hypothetical protein St703_22850 [Sporolactobacillus terrae]
MARGQEVRSILPSLCTETITRVLFIAFFFYFVLPLLYAFRLQSASPPLFASGCEA